MTTSEADKWVDAEVSTLIDTYGQTPREQAEWIAEGLESGTDVYDELTDEERQAIYNAARRLAYSLRGQR